MAAAAASFKTSKEAISSGFKALKTPGPSAKPIGLPSITNNGLLDAPKEAPPLIKNELPAPGLPLIGVI